MIKEASLLVGQACTLALPPPPPRKHAARPAAAAASAIGTAGGSEGGKGEAAGGGAAEVAVTGSAARVTGRAAAAADAPLLSCAELDAAGRSLIDTLLSTRHSGALEKPRTQSRARA